MLKFTTQVLGEEIFTTETPLNEVELKEISERLGREYGGSVSLSKIVTYVPVLIKDGD